MSVKQADVTSGFIKVKAFKTQCFIIKEKIDK